MNKKNFCELLIFGIINVGKTLITRKNNNIFKIQRNHFNFL